MNQHKTVVDFFLGTTSPTGFYGCFDTLAGENDRQLYLIKTGPGCGKSTLMRHVGEKAGGFVERIHCSSDPDSLDGVILHEQNAAVIDATAPHTIEPKAPGACERVVSLYHTLDNDALHLHQGQITQLFEKNGCLRGRAARYLASTSGLVLDSRRAAACCTDFAKVRSYTAHLAARLLPQRDGPGSESKRFLSGITPKGALLFANTAEALATEKLLVLQDEYGAVSRLILELFRKEALARGYHIITCPCALHPEDKIDHIFVPQLGLALLTSNSWHPLRFAGQKNVHCLRFMDRAHLAGFRSRLRFNHKAACELEQQAIALMAAAKAVHDELEVFYKNAVDFAEVGAAEKALLEELGL